MTGFTEVLERAREGFEPPPGGLERQHRRQERRARRRKLATGAVALALALAAFAGAAWIVSAGRGVPASDDRSTITSGNVGDLGLAWTARTDTHGGLHVDPLVVEGLVFLAGDHLFAFDEDCRADGGECEPRWFSHALPGNPQPGETLALVDGDVILQGRTATGVCDGRICDADAWHTWVPQEVPLDAEIVPDGDPTRFRWLEILVRRRQLTLVQVECVAGPNGGSACDDRSMTDLGVAHPFRSRSPTTGGPVLAEGIALATATPYVDEPTSYRFGPYGVPRLIAIDLDCRPTRATCAPRWVGEGPAGVSFDTPVVAGPYAFVRMYEPAERSSRVRFRGILGFRLDCAETPCPTVFAWTSPQPDSYAQVTADDAGWVYVTSTSKDTGLIQAFDCAAGCVPGSGRSRDVFPTWWAEIEGGALAPPLITDDHVYLARGDAISAFLREGPCATRCDPTWTVDLPSDGRGARVNTPIAADGLLFAAPYDGRGVYAIDAEDGVILWSTTLPARVRTNVVVDGDGLYVGGGDGRLYAFRLDAERDPARRAITPLTAIGAVALVAGIILWRRRARARIPVR